MTEVTNQVEISEAATLASDSASEAATPTSDSGQWTCPECNRQMSMRSKGNHLKTHKKGAESKAANQLEIKHEVKKALDGFISKLTEDKKTESKELEKQLTPKLEKEKQEVAEVVESPKLNFAMQLLILIGLAIGAIIFVVVAMKNKIQLPTIRRQPDIQLSLGYNQDGGYTSPEGVVYAPGEYHHAR